MFSTRRATLDDVEALVRLRLALLCELGNITDDTQAARLASANRAYFDTSLPSGQYVGWLAEDGGAVVGAGGVVMFQRPPVGGNLSGLEAYLMNLYTLPGWRGRGVASALLRDMLAFIKGTDARRIWLHTTEAGRLLYEKAGFVATSTEMELIL